MCRIIWGLSTNSRSLTRKSDIRCWFIIIKLLQSPLRFSLVHTTVRKDVIAVLIRPRPFPLWALLWAWLESDENKVFLKRINWLSDVLFRLPIYGSWFSLQITIQRKMVPLHFLKRLGRKQFSTSKTRKTWLLMIKMSTFWYIIGMCIMKDVVVGRVCFARNPNHFKVEDLSMLNHVTL